MAKYKVLLTDTCFPDTSIEEKTLAEYDAELVVAPSTEEKDLIEAGKDCDGVIFDFANMSDAVLSHLTKCKVCSRVGIGVNTIDIPAASKYGIKVANVPDYCLDEVSDHTIALYLACDRRIVQYNNNIRANKWDVTGVGEIFRMRGQNYCLYGFGNIAQKVAQKIKPFGFRIYAYDPYANDEAFKKFEVERVDTLKELFAIADVVSIHAPLNAETEGTVNMNLFKQMKPTSIVINTSRGPIVDEDDLTKALKEKMISAAGLDVVCHEPLEEDSELLSMDNVIITPHVAFYSAEAEEELRRRSALEVMYALIEGKPHSFINRKDFE